MRQFFKRLRSWWLLRRHSAAMRQVIKWVDRSHEVGSRLERQRKKLLGLKTQFDLISQSIMEDIETTEFLQREHEHTLEALQEENKVMRDVTIPQLIAAHQLLLERWDAETAVHVRRRVLSNRSNAEE